MIESLLLPVLILMLVMGTLASNGWDQLELRNREVWWWTGILIIEAILIWPINRYASALLTVNIFGLWQIGRAWHVLRMTIIPIAGIAGAYAVIAPQMQLWMVPYLLTTGVCIGLFLTAWTVVGLIVTRRPFRFMAPLPEWFGVWGIYEDKSHASKHLCGQCHPSHLAALSAFAMACASGLIYLGDWWAVPALVMCYLPQHATWQQQQYELKWGHPQAGHLALCGVALIAIALWDLTAAGIALSSGLVAGTVLIAHKKPWRDTSWWDSGRLCYWFDVLYFVWWNGGWKRCLLGYGTATWFAVTCLIGEIRHDKIYTAAHNEYLQQLLEHGLIGLGVMLVYLGEAFARNLYGVPQQQAVLFLAAAWCAVALVHFPATFYHQFTTVADAAKGEDHWIGSPPLNVWTFVIALLAEVR